MGGEAPLCPTCCGSGQRGLCCQYLVEGGGRQVGCALSVSSTTPAKPVRPWPVSVALGAQGWGGEPGLAQCESSSAGHCGRPGPSPWPVLLGLSLGPLPPALKAPQPGRGPVAAPQHLPAPPHLVHSLSPRSSPSHAECPL